MNAFTTAIGDGNIKLSTKPVAEAICHTIKINIIAEHDQSLLVVLRNFLFNA